LKFTTIGNGACCGGIPRAKARGLKKFVKLPALKCGVSMHFETPDFNLGSFTFWLQALDFSPGAILKMSEANSNIDCVRI